MGSNLWWEYGFNKGKQRHPKTLNESNEADLLCNISNGIWKFKGWEGRWFMIRVDLRKAYGQKDLGVWEWFKRLKPILTICLFFLSTLPFC